MLEHEYDDDLATEELDIELYDGQPDFDRTTVVDDDGRQDDEDEGLLGRQIASFAGPIINDWRKTLEWYKQNENTADIGFDPDGMCLKVCRTARNIPARYPSALVSANETPHEFRIHKVEDIRRGMVAYFDDPRDGNPFSHIATAIGRVRGFEPRNLGDVIFETNSVKSGLVVPVRGDYFERYWGDKFLFAATWLNGYELDTPHHESKVERFNNGGPVYNLNLLAKAGKDRPKPRMVLERINVQIKRLPENPKLVRVREFKDEWRADNKIDLSLLDAAVRDGRVGVVKQVRDEIKRLIATLPDE